MSPIQFFILNNHHYNINIVVAFIDVGIKIGLLRIENENIELSGALIYYATN